MYYSFYLFIIYMYIHESLIYLFICWLLVYVLICVPSVYLFMCLVLFIIWDIFIGMSTHTHTTVHHVEWLGLSCAIGFDVGFTLS